MVGLGFRAISSGQLSPGIAEPLQYSCKSRNEIREKFQDLHRWEPGWVREQFSVVGSQYSELGTRYSALSTQYSVLGTQGSDLDPLSFRRCAFSAEEESAVCSWRETSRFLVASLLGMTNALGEIGQEQGQNKTGAAYFPRPCFQEASRLWLC